MNDAESRDIDFIKSKLGDREWRLNNLYHIKDVTGRKVLFRMNEVQRKLHASMHYRNVIPKARKLGISTFFTIFNLDQILFSENKTAGIIAHRQEDMKRLFNNTVLFAVENLHPWLKEVIGKPDVATANEIHFKNGGQIFVSLTTRGQTPQYLHVSELSYIDKHSPEKAQEIMSGAVNSVAAGNYVSIESTAAGRAGHFYDICMAAERKRLAGSYLTPLDFKIHFFPWWMDATYKLDVPADVPLPKELEDYFREKERELGQKFTREQKWWYAKMKETNGEEMFSEFPSTLEEAFSVSLAGAYYGKDVTAVYAENRLGFFPVDPMYPVDVAFDLGMNDSFEMVFVQCIGPEIRFVDHYQNSGQGLEHYAGVLRGKNYRYGRFILPHDVSVRELGTGVSRLETLWSLGVTNTVTAPKMLVQDGIERVRLIFPRFRFDKQKAQGVLDALQQYRRDWDDKRATWADSPVHDAASHTADAVRMLALVYNEQSPSETLLDEWGKERKPQVTSFF